MNGKLSNEALARFSRDVAKLEALEARREEIARNVLAREEEIGKVRLGYLKQYLDKYSECLNNDIAKKTSELSESFLALENQMAKDLAAATSELEKTKNTIEKSAKNSGGSGSGGNGGGSSNNNSDSSNGNYQMLPDDERSDKPSSQEDVANRIAEAYRDYNDDQEKRILHILEETEETSEANNKRTIRQNELNEDSYRRQKDYVDKIEKTETELYLRRKEDSEIQKNLLTEIRLSRQAEAAQAELTAQTMVDKFRAISDYETNPDTADEAAKVEAREYTGKQDARLLETYEDERAKRKAELEYQYRKKNHGRLTDAEMKAINEKVNKEYELKSDTLDKLAEEEVKAQAKAKSKENKKVVEGAFSRPLSKEDNAWKRAKELAKVANSGDGSTGSKIAGGILVAVNALSSLAQQLDKTIDAIASSKGEIDTRLQGSNLETYKGSYWDQLVKDMMSVGAVTPFFKQEDFAKNIKSLVDSGIAFDLEQRAFLMTISGKIASTFEVADATLFRLIRLQQEDSTAGRLGMESTINAFLNNMYENTEYLKQVADSVRGSLEEMESLMTGAQAAEVEFQVQKWLGSLYSVGMSDSATKGIADALGQIAAGQIEGLTGGGAGNLLIMAANDAGMSIADILTDGITPEKTNDLLQAAVNYLADLADSAKDNKVVQQELAKVFGVKASDLKAATNLIGSTTNIYSSNMNYDNMLERLSLMAGSMGKRTSLAEKMTNVWANGQYTLAGSIASTPTPYLLYKLATLLDNVAGGIPIPFISTMFAGVDLETSVADLMRVASLSGGVFKSGGQIIQGLGNSFNGQKMLSQMGIKTTTGLEITPRGDGKVLLGSAGGGASTVSESGYAGNSSGSDIKDSTMQEAEDSKKQLMIEAQEESESTQIDSINETVLKIYELLDDVANGGSCLKVKVEGYGLTKAGGGSVSALAGVSALNSLSNGGGGSNDALSTSIGGNISLGGWTASV
jgi:hypothetical protein